MLYQSGSTKDRSFKLSIMTGYTCEDCWNDSTLIRLSVLVEDEVMAVVVLLIDNDDDDNDDVSGLS